MSQNEEHPLIVALLRHLPPPGTPWPSDRRRKWLAALEANVGLIYEIVPSPPRRRLIFVTEPPY